MALVHPMQLVRRPTQPLSGPLLLPGILATTEDRYVGGTVTYSGTAFMSSTGNDGSAVLNDLTHPFLTPDATAAALALAYPASPVTIRALSNISGNASDNGDWDTIIANGLTIRSHDATKRTFSGNLNLSQNSDPCSLVLVNVAITTLNKPFGTNVGATPAGVVTLDSTSTIGTLRVSAFSSPAAAGSNGSAGVSGTGTPNGAAQPSPASPPTTGTDGGSFDASAPDDATGGTSGQDAWASITLRGTGTVSSLLGTGQSGGAGGTGGAGATANGGDGGQGGDSNSIVLEKGGTGGAGGDATANGGDGKTGGAGGNGTTVFKEAGITITSSTLTGGAAGALGAGGGGGTANAGSGGAGGAGAVLGPTGDAGADGTATANPGNSGAPAADGADGTIVVI